MARNIWDVSDILLRQRAGDIYGGMFANLGQQVGGAFQQLGEQKKQNKMMEGEIKSTVDFLEKARNLTKDDPQRTAQIDQTLAQLGDPNANLIGRYTMAKGAAKNIIDLVSLGESVAKTRAQEIENQRNQAFMAMIGQQPTQFAPTQPVASAQPAAAQAPSMMGTIGQFSRMGLPTIMDEGVSARAAAQPGAAAPAAGQPQALPTGADLIRLFGQTYGFAPTSASQLMEFQRTLKPDVEKLSDKDVLFNEEINAWKAANPGKIMPASVRADLARKTYGSVAPFSISTASEGAYAKTVGEESAKADLADFNAAQSAVDNISKIYGVLDILESGDPSTGLFAEYENNINRLKSKFMGDVKAGKKVTSTEVLDALLGSDVFPQIQALGIGARGLDTPNEREYLRKVMTGTIELNSDSLKQMAEIRLNIQKRAIERFNTRVDEGDLDKFFETSNKKKKSFRIPERPSVSMPTPDDIRAERERRRRERGE